MSQISLRTIGLALAALLVAAFLHAATSRVTLSGKLYASREQVENGTFQLVGDGDSESLTVMANGYLVDYLRGSVGHRLKITIEPVP